MHNASRKFGRRRTAIGTGSSGFCVGTGRVTQTLAAIKRGSISNRWAENPLTYNKALSRTAFIPIVIATEETLP